MTDDTSAPGAANLLGLPTVRGPRGVEVAVTRPQVQLVLTRLLWDLQPISVDTIAALLWGDAHLPDHWRGAVRGVVSKVRGIFIAAGVEAGITIGVDGRVDVALPVGFVVDLHRARAAIDAADDALRNGCADQALSLLATWVDLLAQPFLPASDGAWVRDAGEQVEELGRRALILQARAALTLGRAAGIEPGLRAWLNDRPLDETVHHHLIEVLVAEGRRTDARRALDRLRDVLDVELGVGPSAATRDLLSDVAASTTEPAPSSDTTPAGLAFGGHDLSVTRRGQMLGRVAESEQLHHAWTSMLAEGRPHVVLLRGPTGIGKTRLALELVSTVRAEGYQAIVCQCPPGASLPFEPLASAIAGRDGSAAELVGLSSASGTGGPTESAVARIRRFELIAAAVDRRLDEPSLLVIDDLQWIDRDALVLLEHIVATTRAPLLVVVTGRELSDVVHAMMARLARGLSVSSSALQPLSADDLLPLFSSQDDAHAAAVALHRHTGGHPFYVAEIIEAARRSGTEVDVHAVPDAVREWIGHRVDALPRNLRSRLDLVAVIGHSVSGVDLAACARVLVDVLIDDLDALVELGLLVEEGPAVRYALPHQIIRDVVYERLSSTRRARLHLAAAEGLSVSDPTINPAVVAEHFLAAGSEHVETAARLLSLSADDAYAQGAWVLAAERQRAILDIVGNAPAERSRALVGLARALHLQGERQQAGACLENAIELARTHGLALALAEAVLALVGRAGRGIGRHDDAEQIRLLEETLVALRAAVAAEPSPPDPDEHRRRDSLLCQIEIELAVALSLWAPIERRTALAMEALARSKRIRPPAPELQAQVELGAHTVRFGPDQVGVRLDAEAKVLALPLAERSLDTTLTALIYRYEDLLVVGRRAEARSHLDAAIGLVERFHHPYWRWASDTWRALDAMVGGDLDHAEHLASAAAQRPGTDEFGAMACLGVTLVNVRLFQGRSGEVLDLLDDAARDHPEVPCYRAVSALCAAEAGEAVRAEAAFEPFRRSHFAAVPYDTNRLLTLAVLADVAIGVGDAESALHLWGLLEPYHGQHAVLNCYGGGGAYWGPVDAQLAGLASLVGRHDEASRLMVEARRAAAAVDCPPVLTRLGEVHDSPQ